MVVAGGSRAPSLGVSDCGFIQLGEMRDERSRWSSVFLSAEHYTPSGEGAKAPIGASSRRQAGAATRLKGMPKERWSSAGFCVKPGHESDVSHAYRIVLSASALHEG
jgi:hypothetical protein